MRACVLSKAQKSEGGAKGGGDWEPGIGRLCPKSHTAALACSICWLTSESVDIGAEFAEALSEESKYHSGDKVEVIKTQNLKLLRLRAIQF